MNDAVNSLARGLERKLGLEGEVSMTREAE